MILNSRGKHRLFIGILGLICSIGIALTLTACGSSPADEAKSLLDSGDYAGAVEKAMTITDESKKQTILEEIMLKAMDAQDVFDYSALGIEDLSAYATTFGQEAANKMRTDALSFMFSDAQEMTVEFPQPNMSDPDCVAAEESGKKVLNIFNEYKKIINADVQGALSDSAKDLDSRYRKICTDTTSLLSMSGMRSYLTSSAVLGSSIGASSPTVDPKTLKNNVERFTMDYNKAMEAVKSES